MRRLIGENTSLTFFFKFNFHKIGMFNIKYLCIFVDNHKLLTL